VVAVLAVYQLPQQREEEEDEARGSVLSVTVDITGADLPRDLYPDR
jgi:hypothetical protein